MEHNILLSLQFSACPTIYIHPPLPVICFITLDNGHSIFGTWEFLFNMIPFDHVNVFYEKGLHYHTINHTIIRVNGLIVTQNLYFLKELIMTLSFYSKKKSKKSALTETLWCWRLVIFLCYFILISKMVQIFVWLTIFIYCIASMYGLPGYRPYSDLISCLVCSLWKEKATKRKVWIVYGYGWRALWE